MSALIFICQWEWHGLLKAGSWPPGYTARDQVFKHEPKGTILVHLISLWRALTPKDGRNVSKSREHGKGDRIVETTQTWRIHTLKLVYSRHNCYPRLTSNSVYPVLGGCRVQCHAQWNFSFYLTWTIKWLNIHFCISPLLFCVGFCWNISVQIEFKSTSPPELWDNLEIYMIGSHSVIKNKYCLITLKIQILVSQPNLFPATERPSNEVVMSKCSPLVVLFHAAWNLVTFEPCFEALKVTEIPIPLYRSNACSY